MSNPPSEESTNNPSTACVVLAQIDDLDNLLDATDSSWGEGVGRQVLYDECSRMFADARHSTGVNYERVNATNGDAQFVFKSAEIADKFCRAVINRFEERNSTISNFDFHIRVLLSIVPSTYLKKGDGGGGPSFVSTAQLTPNSRPDEIWISHEIFESLPPSIREDYMLPDRGRQGRGGAGNVLRVLRPGLLHVDHGEKCVMVVDMAEFSRIQKHEETLNGVRGVARLQNQIKRIMARGFNKAGCSYEDAIREFGGDGGIFTFDTPVEAHKAAVGILESAEAENTKGRALGVSEALRCFRIGIDYGECGRDKQMKLTSAVISRARRLESGGSTGEIRLSSEAYQQLPEEFRQLYGKEEQIRGKKHDQPIPAHRIRVGPRAPWERERASAKTTASPPAAPLRISAGECFVISPIKEGDPRIAAVFEKLIAPACEYLGFEPKRADHIAGSERIPVITGRLTSAPLVIAYLGSPTPFWNPDVMLEVGYRFATGQPLVLMSECPSRKGKSTVSFTKILPFHLVNKSVMEVPKDPKTGVEKLAAQITAALEERSPSDWKTLFPIVEYQFTNYQSDVIMTEASPEAEALFGLKGSKGRRFSIEDRHRFQDRIDPMQLNAYMRERIEIMRAIQARSLGLEFREERGSDPLGNIPTARVPLIFRDAPKGSNGRPIGYLPVIVRYQMNNGTIHLRVLYLKISDAMRQDPAGHWVCDL